MSRSRTRCVGGSHPPTGTRAYPGRPRASFPELHAGCGGWPSALGRPPTLPTDGALGREPPPTAPSSPPPQASFVRWPRHSMITRMRSLPHGLDAFDDALERAPLPRSGKAVLCTRKKKIEIAVAAASAKSGAAFFSPSFPRFSALGTRIPGRVVWVHRDVKRAGSRASIFFARPRRAH